MSHLRSRSFNIVSITRMNNVGESGPLCFSPLSTQNCSVYALFIFTFSDMFSRVSLISLINLEGILF